MNHFIAGILKIALLEAALALLVIDLVAADRYRALRERAHTVITGLMVLAFCNYGVLHPSNDPAMVFTAIPLIWLAGRAIAAAFAPDRQARFDAFVAAAKAQPKRVGSAVFVGALAALVIGFVWMNEVPLGAPGALVGVGLAWACGRGAELAVTRLKPGPGLLVRHARTLAVALAVLLSGGWVAAGVGTSRALLIHQWEQFHFYLGAKYQAEVGWFNLYKAAIIADRESVHVLDALKTTRDLATFEPLPIDAVLRDTDAVKARFSPAQWEAFKADWVRMARLWPIDYGRVISDHGNSNSPAWSIIATPLTKLVPLTNQGAAFLGWLDGLLMLGMWLFLWQVFGHRLATAALVLWAGVPIVFDYSSGSILRWDWLFALGLAAGFLQLRRYGWAGGFFGYAVATKLFPLFFGIALGLRAAMEWRRTRTLQRDHLRFGVTSAATALGAVLLSTLLFGTSAWKEYYGRIEVAQYEKFYAIQYSLKSVALQHLAGTPREWAQAIFPAALKQPSDQVEVCKVSRRAHDGASCSVELAGCGDNKAFALRCQGDTCTCSGRGADTTFTEPAACANVDQLAKQRCQLPENYAVPLLVVQVLFSLLIIALIRRATDVEAFLLGPLLVFTWLTVNMYYWNMLGLLLLGLLARAERPRQQPAFAFALGLHVIFMVFYLYQHLNRGLTEGYAVAWMLAALTVVTAGWEIVAHGLKGSAPRAEDPVEG